VVTQFQLTHLQRSPAWLKFFSNEEWDVDLVVWMSARELEVLHHEVLANLGATLKLLLAQTTKALKENQFAKY
jgi:hypothetical protein